MKRLFNVAFIAGKNSFFHLKLLFMSRVVFQTVHSEEIRPDGRTENDDKDEKEEGGEEDEKEVSPTF